MLIIIVSCSGRAKFYSSKLMMHWEMPSKAQFAQLLCVRSTPVSTMKQPKQPKQLALRRSARLQPQTAQADVLEAIAAEIEQPLPLPGLPSPYLCQGLPRHQVGLNGTRQYVWHS